VPTGWKADFKGDLVKRDGYGCVLSKFADRSHPLYRRKDGVRIIGKSQEPLLTLEGCHIIRCAIGAFDSEEGLPASLDDSVWDKIKKNQHYQVRTIQSTLHIYHNKKRAVPRLLR